MTEANHSANQATQVFLAMEARKYTAKLSAVSTAVSHAKTIAELARSVGAAASAAHPVLRGVLRASPEKRQVDAAARMRGEEIVDEALERLARYRRAPEAQFIRHQGRFIRDVREPSRGHFPSLYHQADRGLLDLRAWRFNHIKTEQDAHLRPESGDDLLAMGYVFQSVSRTALVAIARHGLSSGSFTRTPQAQAGDVILAVHPRHLPPFTETTEVHEAVEPTETGQTSPETVQRLTPDWSADKTLEIAPEFLALSSPKGCALDDSPLAAAASQTAHRTYRPR